MSSATPLLFRPSPAQRAVALLLFLGSWVVGIRGLVLILENVPRIYLALRMAEYHGEPTFGLWVALLASILACAVAGLILLGALLVFLLVEGSQVVVDELGLAVEHNAFPPPVARRLGAGRLTWKQVGALEKGRLFFRVRGGGEPEGPDTVSGSQPVLRFLVVDQLDRLVLIIVERSPHLSFRD